MLNIVIPCAGRGSRFALNGYSFPKFLIDVNGKPMIQVVVENLNFENARYIFLILKEHYDQYSIRYLLPLLCKPNQCEIVIVDKVTEGAACTVLLAEQLINNNNPLLIANSDQYIKFDKTGFLQDIKNKNADGSILTFENYHLKWSYARTDENGKVLEVAEKKPISNLATCGIYFFEHGKDFVSGANKMIERNERINNEFYVCPVYNELIAVGKNIYTYPVEEMHGLGTPEDLEKFLRLKEG